MFILKKGKGEVAITAVLAHGVNSRGRGWEGGGGGFEPAYTTEKKCSFNFSHLSCAVSFPTRKNKRRYDLVVPRYCKIFMNYRIPAQFTASKTTKALKNNIFGKL
jgi:hypothetical protein